MQKIENEDLGRLNVEAFKKAEKTPLVIILDNIRSLNNIGSVFRTADAFLVEKVYLCGITAKPPHREINKTALGATETVEWEYCKETLDALKMVRQQGFQVISVEQAEGSAQLQNVEVEAGRKYALIFGNEVSGVNQEVIDVSDSCVEIPQFGTKHSFNISVSAGIVLWEYYKKLSTISG